MWYVVRFLAVSLLFTSCSLSILGVPAPDSTLTGTSLDSGIHSFSVLGATGGTDSSADSLLTDGTTVTANWVDTTGEESYEVSVLNSTGSTTLCGPVSLSANVTSYSFSSCPLSNGGAFKIQVVARDSKGNSQAAQAGFSVGPFISIGNTTVSEWGIATIPVTLSYAASSTVSVQYVTVDGTASNGTDYIHLPLSTLTIPAGQTSAQISIPVFKDYEREDDETLRVELSSPSGAAILSSSAGLAIQNDDPPDASGFVQIVAGSAHTCGLNSGGGVKCWGNNVSGQLGDNTSVSRGTPTDVFGLTSGVTKIATRDGHSCALLSGGGVQCWGYNFYGQLGDNTTVLKRVPTPVTGLSSGAIDITAGSSHSCAVLSGGTVKCWGWNVSGQLGDNSTTQRNVPVSVFGISSGVTKVIAGGAHTCALLSTGALKCWGTNSSGQLGDGSVTQRNTPVDVSGLGAGTISEVIGGGSHTCAITTSSGAKCWGNNSYGQLGDGTTTQRNTPVDVSGHTSGVLGMAGGNTFSCLQTSGGGMKCWGYNASGQLGDGKNTNANTPVNVFGLSSGVVQITASGTGDHTCAITSAGNAKCWGNNNSQQLGTGVSNYRLTPTDVSELSSGITQVSAGSTHNCALTSSGGVKCWGYNSDGQVGDGSNQSRLAPVDVSGLTSGVTQISTGNSHSCALTSGGAVLCWGSNFNGQLGDNSTTSRNSPISVTGLSSSVIQVATGGSATCAITSVGALKCWGDNTSGRLGDNSTTNRLVPTDVDGLGSGIVQVSMSEVHTCALDTAGSAKCWGANWSGNLGDNTVSERWVPTQVIGLTSGAIQIASGNNHSCVLMSAGSVKCWGLNTSGQLGDNSSTQRLIPTDVFGISSGIAQITAGGEHTCSVSTSGAVQCWGWNDYGQLGDGTQTNRNAPTLASSLSSGIAAVAGNAYHTCALTQSGGVKCWGDNTGGAIGDIHFRWLPQPVVMSTP